MELKEVPGIFNGMHYSNLVNFTRIHFEPKQDLRKNCANPDLCVIPVQDRELQLVKYIIHLNV